LARSRPFDVGQRHQAAGRRVRVGKDDAAVRFGVVRDTDREVVGQRDGFEGDLIQPAIHRVEAVADVGEQDWPPVFEQGEERVGQHLIRAVADEDVAGVDAMVVADRQLELLGIRVGVELKRLAGGGADRVQRARRGAVGVLVGVELDEIGEPGLLARHVGC
jgi:hypothetical protein